MDRINRLSDYQIVNKDTKTEEMFLRIEDHFMANTDIPSVYVKKLWSRYQKIKEEDKKKNEKSNNSLNGQIFEAIIITTLLKERIEPLYIQTALEFVPNVEYDIVVFPKNGKGEVDVSAPVVLSLKTSLRERYKQADLEALALKDVYKRGRTYLVTLEDASSVDSINEKVENRDIRGIDSFINAQSNAFDELVNELKEKTLSEPPQIKVIRKATTVETEGNDYV